MSLFLKWKLEQPTTTGWEEESPCNCSTIYMTIEMPLRWLWCKTRTYWDWKSACLQREKQPQSTTLEVNPKKMVAYEQKHPPTTSSTKYVSQWRQVHCWHDSCQAYPWSERHSLLAHMSPLTQLDVPMGTRALEKKHPSISGNCK
jgi:hypothetical protein